jgi:hypothetical protein
LDTFGDEQAVQGTPEYPEKGEGYQHGK